MSDRFECPISFCDGYRFEHGDDGAMPDTWFHRGADELLPMAAHGSLCADGSGPVEYALSLAFDGAFDATALRVVAAELRGLAEVLEQRSDLLGQFARA